MNKTLSSVPKSDQLNNFKMSLYRFYYLNTRFEQLTALDTAKYLIQ